MNLKNYIIDISQIDVLNPSFGIKITKGVKEFRVEIVKFNDVQILYEIRSE